ncbi:hypothetical protein B0T17DRAFT_507047 [Bombardia bombarda]|uniref:Uncharacterized protein n=1 Tax=Bombardia bombarda TaxID=252184 RepID=A0AA39XC77_9PEZI|nr:hypothetical protein B0T17DRAFT_507047 [Bombardia bombarda]
MGPSAFFRALGVRCNHGRPPRKLSLKGAPSSWPGVTGAYIDKLLNYCGRTLEMVEKWRAGVPLWKSHLALDCKNPSGKVAWSIVSMLASPRGHSSSSTGQGCGKVLGGHLSALWLCVTPPSCSNNEAGKLIDNAAREAIIAAHHPHDAGQAGRT